MHAGAVVASILLVTFIALGSRQLAAKKSDPPSTPPVVHQKAEVYDAMCRGHGERCVELKRKGLWPPIKADYDITEHVRDPLRLDRGGDLFQYTRGGLILSVAPFVVYFPRVLSVKEAAELLKLSQGMGRQGGGPTPLPRNQLVIETERRILALVGLDVYLEPLYFHHLPRLALLHDSVDYPRVASFHIWLSDHIGEMNWPKAGGRSNGTLCKTGLRVRPVAGSGILVYNHFSNGDSDPLAAYAECFKGGSTRPVATKFLRRVE
eukprot:Sspe_Gene.45377::Locus_22444_Transcript_1_1_Confidence_1.000_Length_853::g.45377::m.45377